MEQMQLNSNIKIQQNISKSVLYILLLSILIGNYFITIGVSFIPKTISLYGWFFVWGLLLIKLLFINRTVGDNKKVYYLGKTIDVLFISFVWVISNFNINVLILLYIVLIILSINTKDSNAVKILTIFSVVSSVEMGIISVANWFLKNNISDIELDLMMIYFLDGVLFALGIVLIISLGMFLAKQILQSGNQFEDKQNKIDELLIINNELVNVNAQIKCELSSLQTRNERASRTLAELSTLQQVGEVLNSTLDIKELLNLVNDVIIGILGVTYCTIFLREDGPEKITVKSSNINNEKYLIDLKEKVAFKMFDLIESGHQVIGNNVDPYTYPNGLDRGIESTLFVPILSKGKTLGLILAEHTIENGIDDQTRNFIETIASQIGLAIENAILYEETQRLANTDALTKIYNRMYFQTYYAEEFKKAKGRYPLCAIMMDIDFFKKFNDTYGHDFGDQVLRETANLVKNNLGPNGTISRYGGEEFIIIFKNTNLDEGFKHADRIREIIQSNNITHNGQTANVTVSMGVSEFPKTATNEKQLLKSADDALYKAKEDGRNCVRRARPLSM